MPAGYFDDPIGVWAGSEADELEAADDSSDEGGDDAEEAESESAEPPGSAAPGIHYSADLSDDKLQRMWKDDLSSLGTISVGFADQGRLINAARMAQDEAWVCQRPELAYGTQETVEALETAFRAVHKQFPNSAPARLSHIGLPDGGYLKPHRSHQSGRDADIGFFYKDDRTPAPRMRRDKLMDPARNWALIRALVTGTDVQVILVDRSIQKILKTYALSAGEDKGWVDSLFSGGRRALIQHARRHKDHFHARFLLAPLAGIGAAGAAAARAAARAESHALQGASRRHAGAHRAAHQQHHQADPDRQQDARADFSAPRSAIARAAARPCTKCPLRRGGGSAAPLAGRGSICGRRRIARRVMTS